MPAKPRRRSRMVDYLRIKPINHGQVNTSQIAIPESQQVDIPAEREEALKRSLSEQGSNLIPLLVRRTDAYSDAEEYEVVYGADWCQVAKELDIEKLWVWVFDMTDEQAAATRSDMEKLTATSAAVVTPEPAQVSDSTKQIEDMIKKLEKSVEKKLDTLSSKLEKSASLTNGAAPSKLDATNLSKKLDELAKVIDSTMEEAVNTIHQYVMESIKGVGDELTHQIASIRRELQPALPATSTRKAKAQPAPAPAPVVEPPAPEETPKR